MLKRAAIALVPLLIAGCMQSTPETIDTVSLKYDPYNYSMAKLQRTAEAACRAKGANNAAVIDNDINTETVRWAYMNFECF